MSFPVFEHPILFQNVSLLFENVLFLFFGFFCESEFVPGRLGTYRDRGVCTENVMSSLHLTHTFILANVFIWNFELPNDNMISQTQHIPFVYEFSQEHIWALVVRKLR